jgi:hypothetical protein
VVLPIKSTVDDLSCDCLNFNIIDKLKEIGNIVVADKPNK